LQGAGRRRDARLDEHPRQRNAMTTLEILATIASGPRVESTHFPASSIFFWP
jgi:hypothetical protein